MDNKKKSNLLGYAITFILALLFGTGGFWQYLNFSLKKENLQLEKLNQQYELQERSVDLYAKLHLAYKAILNLNEKYRSINREKSPPNEFNKDYNMLYHSLINRIESIGNILSSIEKRNVEAVKRAPKPILPIAPMRPRDFKITPTGKYLSLGIMSVLIILSLYTLLIIFFTIYVPKLTNQIVSFVKMRTNK